MLLTSFVHGFSGEVSYIAVTLIRPYLLWVTWQEPACLFSLLPVLHWEYGPAQPLVVGLLESERTSKHRFLHEAPLHGA